MQVLTLRGPAVSRVLETYAATLDELRRYVPDLLLTGGAVRDVYFERAVKDLDFMTCDDQAARVVSEFYGEPIRDCLDDPVNEYEGDSNTLIAAYETTSKSANILRVSHHLSHIAQFPDSISQVWTDGENVYASKGFNETVASHVVECTLRMTDERLARIKAKYPDFVFVRGVEGANSKEIC
jgi:hypothetical protein